MGLFDFLRGGTGGDVSGDALRQSLGDQPITGSTKINPAVTGGLAPGGLGLHIDTSGDAQFTSPIRPAAPAPIEGDVLGTSKEQPGGPTTGGAPSGPSDTLLQQLAKMGARNPIQEAQFQKLKAQQGGGVGSGNAELDKLYAGLLGEFGKQEELARGGAGRSREDVLARFGFGEKTAQSDLEAALTGLSGEKKSFLQSVGDALNQNVVDFNALNQRAGVRYGGGSSLGDLMRELAGKELTKQQGLTRREGFAGEAKFAGMIADAKKFMQSKVGELTLWKNESLNKIQDNLQARLADISSQRTATEAEKARAKLGILQEARAQAQQIAQTDAQLRTDIASAYVANLQEIEGRALTPEEVQGVYSAFSNIEFSPFGQAAEQTGGFIPGKLSPEQEDELGQLFTV